MLILNAGDIFAEHYRLIGLIDAGGFADVWEAIYEPAHEKVALKIYPNLDRQGVKVIEEEYEKQKDLSHQYLLTAKHFGYHQGYPFLVMRFCQGGNASRLIGNCDEATAAQCIFQIGSALQYLHDCDIIHKDIKPNNFLRDTNGNFYLADLGLSLKLRTTIRRSSVGEISPEAAMNTGLAPMPYRAPELLDNARRNEDPIKASDIWAFGASIFEMLTGDPPFGEFGGKNQQSDADIPTLPANFSRELNFIVRQFLFRDTWDRPPASRFVKWTSEYKTTNQYLLSNPTSGGYPPPGNLNSGSGQNQGQPKKKSAIWVVFGVVAVLLVGVGYMVSKTLSGDNNKSTTQNGIAIASDSPGRALPPDTFSVNPAAPAVDTPEKPATGAASITKTDPPDPKPTNTPVTSPSRSMVDYTPGSSPKHASITAITTDENNHLVISLRFSSVGGRTHHIATTGNRYSYILNYDGESSNVSSVTSFDNSASSFNCSLTFRVSPRNITKFSLRDGVNQDNADIEYSNFDNWKIR